MRISKKCEYAIRCLMDISLNTSDKPIAGETISKRQEIPEKFLGAILTELKKHRLIRSKKGPRGGYELNKSSTDIYLYDVITLMDGQQNFQIDFSEMKNNSAAISSQVLKDSLAEVDGKTIRYMEKFSLRELTTRCVKMVEASDSYSI